MPTLAVLSVADLVEILRDSAAAMEAHSPGIDDLATALQHVSGNSDGAPMVERDSSTTGHRGVGADCARSIDSLQRLLNSSRPASFTEFAGLLSGVRPASDAQRGAGATLIAWWQGFAEACRNLDTVGAVQLGIGLELAAESASEVDKRPGQCVGITMQRAAAAALLKADNDGDLAAAILAAADAGLDHMEEFAQTDPQLSEAGVVDAATASWLVILESFVSRICGEDESLPTYEFEDPDAEEERSEHMFHLKLEIAAPQAEIRTIELGWMALGDFIEIVALDSAADVPQWRLSLCTDHVGPAIEMVLQVGRPHTVEVGLASTVPHG